MLRYLLLVTLGVSLFVSSALCAPCWESVVPQNVVGFDFEMTSVVQGPDSKGLYTYTYTVYRHDQGYVIYKGVSHIALWFPCGVGAQSSIVGGAKGISMTCNNGSCQALEMGGANGMTEPVMDPNCRFFWGIKFEQCIPGDDYLLPDFDEISYPADSDDPYCTITFMSTSRPEWGKWLIKGGGGRSGLYDSGSIQVPTCVPPVATGTTTWGSIKSLYR